MCDWEVPGWKPANLPLKNARKRRWLVRLKIAQTILSTVRNPKQKWDGRVLKYIWTQMNTNYRLTFDRYKRGSFRANNASVGIDFLPSLPSIVRTHHSQLFFEHNKFELRIVVTTSRIAERLHRANRSTVTIQSTLCNGGRWEPLFGWL